ncbi:MAG: AAA family ATPase [Planctomycetaceae bacterium]|jgi:hypothetical protein|nr:AAA family ATPase [Planctomycetaceae bacterium]
MIADETSAIRWSRLHFRIANISPGVSSDLQAERLHPRIAGVSPACGCTQPPMREVKISTAFLFALRQNAGETPAIRWSHLHFKIAGISGSQTFQDRKHFAWCFVRFAGGTPVSQDRGRLACTRLYSTANERGFDLKRLFVCLAAKCGLKFIADNGDLLELSDLSSGEQHEIVLLFDLLFQAASDTLVLIDEPEISLHIVWQKAFLADMLRIIKLRKISVLVATHSPQIVNDNWENIIDLGGNII